MVKICSMDSIVNPSGFVLHQEQSMSKVFKDCVHLLPSPGVGRDASRSGFLKLRPCQFQEEPWKPIDRLLESNKCVKIDSMVKQPVLINAQVQDARPSIAENLTEHDKISCTGTGFKMKDLLSLVAEIYPSKDSTACTKQPLLTPYFDRLDEAQTIADPFSPPELQSLTFAPLKSPEKTNPNPSKKKRKRNFRKVGRGFRNLHNKNIFHACESLLSLIANRRQHAKSAIRSLKTSGPELPNLLTQFSAGIAGTGLAVVFSIISRVASGRVPFCTSKALNTGFGFGLVWLAWAVNGLRDTIVSIRKNSSKNASADETGLKEDERLMKVDSSLKEIYFRAATLMALAVLKLA